MLTFLVNNFVEFSSYSSNFIIPLINYLPITLYLSAIFWSLSLILNSSASTRTNLTTPKFRLSVTHNLVNLYKL